MSKIIKYKSTAFDSHDIQEIGANSSTTPTLSENAKDIFRENSKLKSTRENYNSDVKYFLIWFNQFVYEDRPPCTVDIINFLTDQYNGDATKYNKETKTLSKGLQISVSSLDRKRWGILKYFDVAKIPYSQREKIELRDFIGKLREKGEQQNPCRPTGRGQKEPLRAQDIISLLTAPIHETKTEFVRLRDKAIIATAYVSGARESEILGDRGLRFKDVTIYSEYIEIMRAILKRGDSKRDHNCIINKGSNHKTCPYTIIKQYYDYLKQNDIESEFKAYLLANNIQGELPFFLRASRYGKITRTFSGIKATAFDGLLRVTGASAGMDEEKLKSISGHSTRNGLIVTLLEQDTTHEAIQDITGQTFETISHYGKKHKKKGTAGGL